MTFFTIIVRGLMRRPVRTGLTLVGISIGIAAVVALVGISRGFEQSWAQGMKARGTDVVVSNMGSALAPKPFTASVRERIAGIPQVAATCSIFVDLTSIEDSSMMIVSAREWGGFSWQNLKLVKKTIGEPIQVEARELTVVGIVDGGALVENGSVILSLPLYQDISGNEGKINIIDVRVASGMSEDAVKKLCVEINALVPEARAMLAGEHVGNSEAHRFISAMSWGTSLLAVIASKASPTIRLFESPSWITGNLSSLIFKTATSDSGSVPTRVARACLPSLNITSMSEAPSITWLLVSR